MGLWEWLRERWKTLSDRPTSRRVARVSEELASDAAITIVFMVAIYCVGEVARWLGIDKQVVAGGVTIGDIVHMLHAANLLVNGYFALKHLIDAHRSDHDE